MEGHPSKDLWISVVQCLQCFMLEFEKPTGLGDVLGCSGISF